MIQSLNKPSESFKMNEIFKISNSIDHYDLYECQNILERLKKARPFLKDENLKKVHTAAKSVRSLLDEFKKLKCLSVYKHHGLPTDHIEQEVAEIEQEYIAAGGKLALQHIKRNEQKAKKFLGHHFNSVKQWAAQLADGAVKAGDAILNSPVMQLLILFLGFMSGGSSQQTN